MCYQYDFNNGAEKVLEFPVRGISHDIYLKLMDQYRPCYCADGCPALSRTITIAEYV